MLTRTALIVTLLAVTSCSTKPSPSPLFGPIPDDAGDLLAQICADTDYGVVEADPDLAIAKVALARNVPPPPGVEAIMCAPQDGPNPALNSLAFDHATRRLYGLRAMVTYADFDLLERLLLPALTPQERSGYAVEKMRLLTPWMGTSINHDWTDGHFYIWTARAEAYDRADDLRPPTPATKFQIRAIVRD